VDLVGIEPTTSSMPWKRAPSCATGPHKTSAKSSEEKFRTKTTSQRSQLPEQTVTPNSRPPFPLRQTHLGYGRRPKVPDRSPMSTLQTNPAPFQCWRVRRRRSVFRLINLGSIATLAVAGFAPSLAQEAASSPPSSSAPVAYASVSELNGILGQLKTTAAAMQTDVERMRIEKWKTDASNKKQTQANADSVRRNLQSALPEIISQVSASPEDLSASFKLYRNLDALYDVFGSVVESAGAFGSKDEFQSLSNDMNGLESARRSMGERMQKLAGAKEDELTRLRAQVKTLSAAPPPPPKKIIVDDTEPPKKPAAKKKTTKPAASNSGAPAKTPKKPAPGAAQNPPPSQ
jgi:hypothetical protein